MRRIAAGTARVFTDRAELWPISIGMYGGTLQLSSRIDRVTQPARFYAKDLDGRIDDPNAGWKGRGVWTTSGDRAPWLKEGGKGTVPIAFHFQFRPAPLAD